MVLTDQPNHHSKFVRTQCKDTLYCVNHVCRECLISTGFLLLSQVLAKQKRAENQILSNRRNLKNNAITFEYYLNTKAFTYICLQLANVVSVPINTELYILIHKKMMNSYFSLLETVIISNNNQTLY